MNSIQLHEPLSPQVVLSALVLCVDDDANGLILRKRLLEGAGYTVVCAFGANAGLCLFFSLPIQLVILDYSMPVLNGAQVATAMRKAKPEVPIIMLSALPQCPDDARGVVDDYLVKGEGPEILLNGVHEFLVRSAISQRKKESSPARRSGKRSSVVLTVIQAFTLFSLLRAVHVFMLVSVMFVALIPVGQGHSPLPWMDIEPHAGAAG